MGQEITRRGLFGHAAGLYVLASGVTVGAVVAADPIVEAITAYIEARDRVLAMPMTETGKEIDEAYEANVLPLFWKIDGLAPTTMAGAALAMRFLQQQNEGGRSVLAGSLTEGVAKFLEGQSA